MSTIRSFRKALWVWLLLAALVVGMVPTQGVRAQSANSAGIFLLPGIGISSLPYNYTQDFNNPSTSMPVTGSSTWTDNSTVSGWSAKRTGTGTTVVADAGTNTGGNLYSYGAASNADRALGSLGSGNAAAGNFFWGVCFTNNSGNAISQLNISYDGEQWRKSGVTVAQTVDFDYQIGATCVEVNATSGWVAYNALDFSSPVNTATAAAVDGNSTGKVSLSSTMDISLPNGQAITLRWSDPDHSGSDQGMAIDNFSLNAVAASDSAPAVSSTTPANGASGVATGASLGVNFSEDVTANGNWAQVVCSSSGTQNVGAGLAVSGGPQNFTLDPATDFTAGETCTATIFAAQISDQDANDPPDTLAANHTWSFTVAAADSAPAVSSTTPANGASGVATGASLGVNFSEDVTANGNWAQVVCSSSGTQNVGAGLAVSGGPQNFTLDPATDFTAGETCTATIFAAQISDQDANDPPDTLAANYTWSFTVVAADSAPAVSSTTPANGASGVATGASLSVNFSEDVTANGNWAQVVCSSSGTQNVGAGLAVSGGPQNFTIDPATDFTAGETCTATIFAAQISDQDTNDPPDTLAANYTWSFTVANASGCGSLFFSEYIEGSSNNKAVEIFNGTGSTVNLGTYTVELYSNGSATPSASLSLSGSLNNGETYVIGNSSAGTQIQAAANLLNSTVVNFNGDDALVLKNNGTVVDSLGQTGFDPGSFWGTAPTRTQDQTLMRQGSISSGDTTPADVFDPALEWEGYAIDTFDGLGSHSASCAGGADTAPRVVSTTPASGAGSVAVDTNISINFNEPVNVTGTWFDVSCTTSGAHTAAVSGGPQAFTLDPASDLVSNETCTVTIYAAQVSDQDANDPPDTMAANRTWSFTTVGSPTPCSTIPLIQGSGNASTCLGARSNIQGCITGVGAAGFYMQDTAGDGNALTSDGIYVYMGGTWTNPGNWAPGRQVTVSGSVVEYYNTTEFQSGSTVSYPGTTCTLPTPVSVSPIADPAADPMALYERYEGMRVQMSFDGWVVGPTKRFDSRYTVRDPEIAFVDFSSSIVDYSRVFERDYSGYQGINYLGGGLNFDLPDLDFGDRLSGTNISGVLGYQFDKYTLLVDAIPALTTVDNPDVSAPQVAADPQKNEFDVCYYNVENLFDNVNDGNGDWGDWAPGYPTSGSAAGLAAYQAHRDETAAVLYNAAKGCAIIGVEEVEGKQQIYNELAAALSALDPAHDWAAIYVESGDSRDISQGFLYRDDVTRISGPTPVSGSPYTGWVTDGSLDFRRVPASATFRVFDGTPLQTNLTVYGLHFKSKGSSTGCTTDDCTDVREKEAADLRDILAHHQTAGEYAIAGGDFNDTLGSSPIAILEASPAVYSLYNDLPVAARYSYIFSGESEVLDHIYVTRNLLTANGFAWEHAFSPVHVNADFSANEHASDHDPVRVRFLGADLSDLAASYGEAWHTLPRTIHLGSVVSQDAGSGLNNDNASDDGVVRTTGNWAPGNSVSLQVTVSGGSGWLTAWFDWNLDGDFNDANEKTVNQAVSAGMNTISFVVPAGIDMGGGPGNTARAARFRLYESATEPTSKASQVTGGASGGEVEDYLWEFTPTAVTWSEAAAHSTPSIAWGWLAGGVSLAFLAAVKWLRPQRRKS